MGSDFRVEAGVEGVSLFDEPRACLLLAAR